MPKGKKKVPTRTKAVDLDEMQNMINYQRQGALPKKYSVLPADFNCHMTLERVIGQFGAENVEGMIGHIMSFEFITQRQKLTIKSFRDPQGIQVLLDGEVVLTSMVDDTYPGPREANARRAEADAGFVAANDIEPGDVVDEGPMGEVIIIREAPAKPTKKASKKKAAPKPEPEEEDITWE